MGIGAWSVIDGAVEPVASLDHSPAAVPPRGYLVVAVDDLEGLGEAADRLGVELARSARPAHVRPFLDVTDHTTRIELQLPGGEPWGDGAEVADGDTALPAPALAPPPTLGLWLRDGLAVIALAPGGPAADELVAELARQPDLAALGPGAVALEAVTAVLRLARERLEDIADGMQVAEAIVFSESTDDPSRAIYALARHVTHLRSAVLGLDIPIDRIEHHELPGVSEGLRHRFGEAGHALDHVLGQLDAYADALSNALQSHLAKVAARQNEDMRRISAWAALAALPTAVAGVYGMNFRQGMPLLDHPSGFWVIMGITLVACGFLYRALRRAGWI